MSTTTLTKPKSVNADSGELRKINGITWEPDWPLDNPVDKERQAINIEADAISRLEDKVNDRRDEVYAGWLDLTFREARRLAFETHPWQREIVDRKAAAYHARHVALPKSEPSLVRYISKLEAERADMLDGIAEVYRAGGIDEYSMPNGMYTPANPQGARDVFLKTLHEEPEVLRITGAINKAKNALAVLISQYPILPTRHNTAVRWRSTAVVVPQFISQLFVLGETDEN